MNYWSNIETSLKDPEIIKINNLEKTLGILPAKVNKIRELITRFEVCHFKYQNHLEKIKVSILNLGPVTDTDKIGINHIKHGEDAWRKDKTGRSEIGQQYLWAFKEWLDNETHEELTENYNKTLSKKIQKRLGEKNPDKIRLVRLLIARMTWDWKAYEELQKGDKHKELEQQICRMDICHYAFPDNLDLLLQGIGKMKPVAKFEGCGSLNDAIKINIEKEIEILNYTIENLYDESKPDTRELIRFWLLVCLAKTLKEQVKSSKAIGMLDKQIK